ncbi:unnamed protein product [Notodromas monacha]|uniref:Uncharacterized protein n=1 Tax=Notodromas monacha TaxID=399045 RepID=A0A7R9BTZ2_9CRUS|nr:unnamed protein product [Notodromas monacha]CAG0921698.1 unnamed protein product [Notodromas monacha]
MWNCQKCSKPVFFAERKQSMGFMWHPDCLRCEECGKRLNPGQHAEHRGSPYCHIPCYPALFGPQLFGHGSKVESHSSFGKNKSTPDNIKKSHLESKVRLYNQFWEGRRGELSVREVNGRLVLEGVLRIYWNVSQEIRLKEDDDRRIRIQAQKRQSYRLALEDDGEGVSPEDTCISDVLIKPKSTLSLSARTLPSGLSIDSVQKIYPSDGGYEDEAGPASLESENLNDHSDVKDQIELDVTNDDVTKVAKVLLRRRPGRKMTRSPLKRRKSMINGHCYDVTTSTFTPPTGSVAFIWVSSMVNASEVVNMLLEKYKIQSPAENFALYAVWDHGEQRELKSEAYPLLERVYYGPNEDVVKLYIMDRERGSDIPPEVSQYLNFSLTELSMFIEAFYDEEEREVARIQTKYRHEKLGKMDDFPDENEILDYHEQEYQIMLENERQLQSESSVAREINKSPVKESPWTGSENLFDSPARLRIVEDSSPMRTPILSEVQNVAAETHKVKRSLQEILDEAKELAEHAKRKKTEELPSEDVRIMKAIAQLRNARKEAEEESALMFSHNRQFKKLEEPTIFRHPPEKSFVSILCPKTSRLCYALLKDDDEFAENSKITVGPDAAKNLLDVQYADLKLMADQERMNRLKRLERSVNEEPRESSDADESNDDGESSLWVDKYRPKSYMDLLSDENVKNR